ncbi:MAG TPA: response regulator [Xanthomonadales bacterium]|nr:response regulator [Xanthomonadales bacterium]
MKTNKMKNPTTLKLRGTRKKIMVADDDPGILDATKIMLEEAGYEVETTVDGAVVRDVHEEYPDLILLDIWMSSMNGTDICKHLKSNKLTKHIPIIMFSANKDTEKIAKVAGADDFLAKPFQMEQLLVKVAEYVLTK